MNEFQKFVVHIRNLKAKKIKQATFDVDFLSKILEDVSPTPITIKKAGEEYNKQIEADGGRFVEE